MSFRGEDIVDVGDVIDIEIGSLGHEGEGIGRFIHAGRIERVGFDGIAVSDKGLAVFVPGALPGDLVRCRVTEVKKRFARAEIVEILRESPGRIEPKCPVYADCGGCQLQNYDYERQLDYKTGKVVEALKRIAGMEDPPVLRCIGSEPFMNYRNRAQFAVSLQPVGGSGERGKNGKSGESGVAGHRLVIGFREMGSHSVCDVEECLLLNPLINKIMRELRLILEDLKPPIYGGCFHVPGQPVKGKGKGQSCNFEEKRPYCGPEGKGLHHIHEKKGLHHILVKVNLTGDEAMVVLIGSLRGIGEIIGSDGADNSRQNEETGAKNLTGLFSDLIKRLKEKMPEIKSVIYNYNPKDYGLLLGAESATLYGEDHIIDHIGDLKFRISPHSFFQVNSNMVHRLYEKVREFAGLTGTETMLDAFSGVGSISLFLARDAAKVIGIEEVSEAVGDAVANAALNQIDNARFIAGKVEDVLGKEAGRAIIGDKEIGASEDSEAKGLNWGISAIDPVDVIVLDPPRSGCDREALEAMAEMGPKRIVYVSCDPATLARDIRILQEIGYECHIAQPMDMFPMTSHVECVTLMSRVGK